MTAMSLEEQAVRPRSLSARVRLALRRENWRQLGQFLLVGASGYVVNLVVYTLLLGLGAHTAAAISFAVSVVNNYWWNRHWTFAGSKGSFGLQGARFLAVAVAAFAVNQLWLFLFLDQLGLGKVVAQALAIALVVPVNFIGNKIWTFR